MDVAVAVGSWFTAEYYEISKISPGVEKKLAHFSNEFWRSFHIFLKINKIFFFKKNALFFVHTWIITPFLWSAILTSTYCVRDEIFSRLLSCIFQGQWSHTQTGIMQMEKREREKEKITDGSSYFSLTLQLNAINFAKNLFDVDRWCARREKMKSFNWRFNLDHLTPWTSIYIFAMRL